MKQTTLGKLMLGMALGAAPLASAVTADVTCGTADGNLNYTRTQFLHGAVPTHPYPVSRSRVTLGTESWEWTNYSDGTVQGDQNLSVRFLKSKKIWEKRDANAAVQLSAVTLSVEDGTALAPLFEGEAACARVEPLVLPPTAPPPAQR